MHKNSKNTYGQNFIYDDNLLTELVDLTMVNEEDNVFEIGAGAGTLTRKLANKCNELISVEIDSTLLPYLIFTESNVKIINEDVLKLNLEDVTKHWESFKVIANIPYYITTEILHKLLFNNLNILQISCMVQLEVANKICAKPENKDSYSLLSLLCQHKHDTSILKVVPAECFNPVPKVDSAFVNLKLKENFVANSSFDKYYYSFVKACFAHRRKTLINSLKPFGYDIQKVSKALDALKINQSIRAEALNYNDFINIINIIRQA